MPTLFFSFSFFVFFDYSRFSHKSPVGLSLPAMGGRTRQGIGRGEHASTFRKALLPYPALDQDLRRKMQQPGRDV